MVRIDGLKNLKGFTLIELIAAMVLVGVAAAMAGVSFMSFSNIGRGKETVMIAQLAQQRLELILAEKRKSGFPEADEEDGPDPCSLYTGLDDVCNDAVTVVFSPDSNDNSNDKCNAGNKNFEYCDVTVTITMGGKDYPYSMRLDIYD